MWEISPFTLVVFSTDDCTTDDCPTNEPSLGLLSASTTTGWLRHPTTDGCAIHDTREGVPILVRLHGDLIMCDVFVIIGTRWVWTAVMPEADALAHVIRHKGRVYAPRDDDSIPF